jgi:hypothetical protein
MTCQLIDCEVEKNNEWNNWHLEWLKNCVSNNMLTTYSILPWW